MYTKLEDEFGDVVGKARRGQELSLDEVASAAGLAAVDLERIEAYEVIPPKSQIDGLAMALNLDGGALVASASESFFPLHPAGRPLERGAVEMVTLGSNWLMNGYVFGCTETGRGVVIDPGYDAERILRVVEMAELEIELVLLTHGHHDHVGALSQVCQTADVGALLNSADLELIEPLSSKIDGSLTEGQIFTVGKLELRVASTPGHTAGGVTFVGKGVAFVGDALFAGSMGGTRSRRAYETQLTAIRKSILSLGDEVTLFPGHGPATTVSEEKAHNPFFAS